MHIDEGASQRPDVCLASYDGSTDKPILLRGHEVVRALDTRGNKTGSAGQALGEAKVGQECLTSFIHQYIVWLEVKSDDVSSVQLAQPFGHRQADA